MWGFFSWNYSLDLLLKVIYLKQAIFFLLFLIYNIWINTSTKRMSRFQLREDRLVYLQGPHLTQVIPVNATIFREPHRLIRTLQTDYDRNMVDRVVVAQQCCWKFFCWLNCRFFFQFLLPHFTLKKPNGKDNRHNRIHSTKKQYVHRKKKLIRKKEKHFEDALCDDLNNKTSIEISSMGKWICTQIN